MHRIITIGAFLCAIASAPGAAADAKPAAADAKDACRQGKGQYAAGDVVKAIKTLGKCVERETRNREAWISLANANLEAGRFPQSAEAFARAESLKPGDETFLASYLSALEGAGKIEERIPVLRALAGKKPGDRRHSESLLAAVEAAGPEKHPDEYLFALQSLAEGPEADRYTLEKLAAAYLKRGKPEKAEAEYRGLLVKNPESAEDWAGLGASQAAADPRAAAECYRKAAFYSNNAGQRTAYQNEHQRLSRAAAKSHGDPTAAIAEDSKEQAILFAPAAPVVAAASAPATPAAKPEPVKPTVAAAKPLPASKPFDVTAFQDSIYKAELEKRLAKEEERKNGDEPGAIAYLEKLAEKRPGEIKYQEELAAYYRGKGDRARASLRYSRIFILNASHPEANYWLGMEAAKAGDNALAVPMLERAVAAAPARSDAWKALAKGYAMLSRKEQAWDAYKKAFSLLPSDLETARGKLEVARESHPAELAGSYEDVLRIAPQDAEAALGLARLRFQEGNFAAAEKNYRIVCKDSKDSRAWAEFGRSLLELKRTDEAAAALQKAVDLGEKDPSLRLDLARIRMDKGDLDWAEALLKDLAKKAPADPEPLYRQGQIALKRQQTAVAEEFFRKAHQLKPAEGRYAEALARSLRDKDDWKSAVSALAQAESGLTLSGRLLYGECLAHGGDYAGAREVYAALYRKEASAPLLSRRMDLLVRMGKADQAVELAAGAPFQDATEVRYSLAKAQLSLADAQVLKGDVDQAVDLMKLVLKTDDHRPEYHYYLGLGYFDQNRPKKALSEFADALTYRVDYPEALYRKGLCQIRLEDAKDAENSFGELSQHADPAWKARGLYGLAMAFEAQGKPEAVRHHLERSIASSPLPEAMAFLSRVNLKQNKVVEAQEWARKALAADPSNEAATVALAEALASGKMQAEAMELARQGLKARPLSCGLLVQTAKLNYEAGKLDSTLAMSSNAIRICPGEKMAYYYAGIATRGSNRPEEAKRYFKSFRKLGGDKKMVPEE
ncbi:MAG TPA: tetratricopeptide repeat protein [Fibrobacteria bacterium]|nr:tetratricopeptide repeat protein [Fibrobacteria bacterium]